MIDVSCCGALYCESREGIAQMRNKGRPSDYAERAVGGIGMFDFDILRQHRREGCAFANPITKRAPKHSREIGTSGSDDDIPPPILPILCMSHEHGCLRWRAPLTR